MNISDINFSKVVFPLEKELLDVCDGDIEEKVKDRQTNQFSWRGKIILMNWLKTKEIEQNVKIHFTQFLHSDRC